MYYLNHVVKPSGQTASDTKTRILDAADAVFVRRGIDGARMQDIADHAGWPVTAVATREVLVGLDAADVERTLRAQEPAQLGAAQGATPRRRLVAPVGDVPDEAHAAGRIDHARPRLLAGDEEKP